MTLLSAILLLCCVAMLWQRILLCKARDDIGDLTRRIEWMLDDEPHAERIPPEAWYEHAIASQCILENQYPEALKGKAV